MSIIGTRPPLISETNFYELHHRARLAIKPGITGMWQVSGRSDITDFEEVVRLDKEYITNWNIGLDIDDENIAAFLQNVINKLKAIKIQPETQRQWITQEQPVDVVQIWIAKDYLDVSDIKNFAYQAYWENDDILYWCKQLGTSRVQIENMA